MKISLTSFNGYPQQSATLHRPERYRELLKFEKPTIARGLGKSYGDAALNENGHIVLTERLNRFLDFDAEQGILTAEAGTTLTDILTLITPKNWFLPVSPGTQYLTLGGCIAADVHGKNHHRTGAFSNYVLWLDLITADGNILRCDRKHHTEIFWATMGGLGLTGIIGAACIQLQPISTPYMTVVHRSTADLAETLAVLNDQKFEDEYSVAWIDTLSSTKNPGRSIVMNAHHSTQAELPTSLSSFKKSSLTIPFNAPKWLLNQTSIKFFNHIYYRIHQKKTTPGVIPYQNYFYPLDKIKHWNKLYGKRGFLQYQCVFPNSTAAQGLEELFQQLQQSSFPVFLAVLKRLGPQSNGLLAFPMPGITLALDLPIINDALFKVLDQLDEIVVRHQGRVYLAKDARLSPENFRIMYPDYAKFQTVKNQIDPEGVFSSSLSRRLKLS